MDYLRRNIRYELGGRERAGLKLFLRMVAEEGLAPGCELQDAQAEPEEALRAAETLR